MGVPTFSSQELLKGSEKERHEGGNQVISAIRAPSSLEASACQALTPTTPATQQTATPLHGKNELFRVTSRRRKITEPGFWTSLPTSSRAQLVLTGLAAASVLAFCVQQFILGYEALHILLAELAAAAFSLWFAVEAVNHENAFELLAQAIVAFCIAGRLIYFMATIGQTAAQIAVCSTVLLLLFLQLCMALVSYGQFGWRLYSKIACDLRAKDAQSKQKTHLLVHVFLTVLKLDALLLLVQFLIGTTSGARPADHSQPNLCLLVANPLGLLISGMMSAAIFLTVRNDWSKMELPMMAMFPIGCVMPIVNIAVALDKDERVASRSRVALALAAFLFMALRLVVTILMQVLVSRFRYLHLKDTRGLSDPLSGTKRAADEAPAELAALMRGAWIGKPSASAPKKRRFFQLSSDGSTLRWAWDKYVLLYFVEAQLNNDIHLEIILKMAMEPDLVLKFDTGPQYWIWKQGLETAIQLLEHPMGVCNEDLKANEQSFGEVTQTPHGMLRLVLLESRLPGKYTVKLFFKEVVRRLSCSKNLRHSVKDPQMKHFNLAKQRAYSLHTLGVGPAMHHSGATAEVHQASIAGPETKHKRGSTIPSIQEFIEAISRGTSPERSQAGYQSQRATGKRRKELVINSISPNTKQVHLSSHMPGQTTSGRDSARSLFKTHTPDCLEAPVPTMDAVNLSREQLLVEPQQPQTARLDADKLQRSQSTALPPHFSSLSQHEQTPSRHSEAIDSQECLDTVGPLPSGGSRPQSAALLKGSSASKMPVPLSSDVVASPAREVADGPVLRERVEVIIQDPVDPRWDAVRRSTGDANATSPSALHPLIQRTRTTSSSSSLIGQSPLDSQGNSGNYTSEAYSYAASMQSQSTASSIASLYSNGPLKISVPFIPIQDIIVGRCLGEGSEGIVYAGNYLETPVAIKQLRHVQEMEMNLHIGSHDNVVALRGISKKDENLILVMEYCPKATLHLLLHGTAQSELDAYKLTGWVRAIARGMLHLHTRKPPILHRDLKPANIFVGHGFVMKIGDFGMSRHVCLAKRPDGSTGLLRQLSSGVIGTAAYAAPELLEGQDISADQSVTAAYIDTILKSDVYSFGVTLWEMMTRKRPFSDMMSYQIQHAWMADPEDMQLPPVQVPLDMSPPASRNFEELAALVRDCTEHEPYKRPSFHEICRRLRNLPARNSSVLSSPVTPMNEYGFQRTGTP